MDRLGKKIEQFYRVKYERSWSYIMPMLCKIQSLSTTYTTTDEQELMMVFHWGEILQSLQTLDINQLLECVEAFLDWYNLLPANTFVPFSQSPTSRKTTQATDEEYHHINQEDSI